jgi:hypothetical protein
MCQSEGRDLDTLLLSQFFIPIRNAAPWQTTEPVRFIDVSQPFPPPKSFVRKRRPYAAIVF